VLTVDQLEQIRRAYFIEGRSTARRIYDRLVTEFGFRGGESTVRQYVRERTTSCEIAAGPPFTASFGNRAGPSARLGKMRRATFSPCRLAPGPATSSGRPG
jgi:hypothetical protein